MAEGRRGLVLGGGGVTGVAWELGLLAGLAETDLDLTEADLIVGTSAGSAVGAQVLSGVPLEELYSAQLEDPGREIAARLGLGFLLRLTVAAAWPGEERRGRAWLGRAALAARTVPEAERREVIAARLPRTTWPERDFKVTSVDAETGEFEVFDRDSGVSLVDAVAASCAVPIVWPPVTIKGRRYIDGGMRSATNADLARGCERVVVLAPISVALRRRNSISSQLASLGPDVRSVVVSPDAAARKAIGGNVLDPTHRVASARAGRAQAASAAQAVAAVWSASNT
jgi:NTE family protein